jgi:hypothetical protein
MSFFNGRDDSASDPFGAFGRKGGVDAHNAWLQAQNAYQNYQEQAPYEEMLGRSRDLIGESKGLFEQAVNDPTDQFILERLKSMADPRQQQDALFTQGADQATAAAAARWGQQQDSLAMRGLTPQSGAYQSAQNQNMMQRQQGVQQARLQATLAGNQQSQHAMQQLQGQQQGKYGRQQGAFGTYAQQMATPVGVRPQGSTNTGGMPRVDSGAGATYKPLGYDQFTQAWAQQNAPKPSTFFGR